MLRHTKCIPVRTPLRPQTHTKQTMERWQGRGKNKGRAERTKAGSHSARAPRPREITHRSDALSPGRRRAGTLSRGRVALREGRTGTGQGPKFLRAQSRTRASVAQTRVAPCGNPLQWFQVKSAPAPKRSRPPRTIWLYPPNLSPNLLLD